MSVYVDSEGRITAQGASLMEVVGEWARVRAAHWWRIFFH